MLDQISWAWTVIARLSIAIARLSMAIARLSMAIARVAFPAQRGGADIPVCRLAGLRPGGAPLAQ